MINHHALKTMSENTSPAIVTVEKPLVPAKTIFWTPLDWRITLFNEVKNDPESAKDVSVMIFQAADETDSYSSAWCLLKIPSPGRVGPIKLPKKVQFGVLDKIEDDIPRLSGPVDIEFGQHANVVQKNEEHGAQIMIEADSQPGKEIKATNSKGNVQSLEMALYKNSKKLVSFKDVVPNTSVSFLLQPEVVYVIDGANIAKGEDFKASDEIDKATKFSLTSDKLDVNIKITRKSSGELEFSELEQEDEHSTL